jgi:hemerythrin-like domain-containing protein
LASGRSGAPEIMVTLNSEHRYIASLLEALSEQADNLLPGRQPDYGMMFDIVHYMASFPDEYHHPREDLVFERLVKRDPESRVAVEELLEGHREINRRSRELLDHLERVKKGVRTADDQKLKYLCDRYIGYYWEHINTEEGTVFPRATAKLRQDDWFAVNSEAKFVDDPLFGSRVRKEYQRLSTFLQERVGRVTEEVAIAELFGVEALIEAVVTVGEVGDELRGIVSKRARRVFAAPGSEGEKAGGVFSIPGRISSAICTESSEGAREFKAVVMRARQELKEPFAARMQYLRKMLRGA